jgi:uncharacterized protein (TIGR02246 family)
MSAFGGKADVAGPEAEEHDEHMRQILLASVITFSFTLQAVGQQIAAINENWVAFFDTGDFDSLGLLYTEDAVALPPGASTIRGREAIVAMWKGRAQKGGNPKMKTSNVKRLGPSAALEIGTYTAKTTALMRPEVTGKYLVVWEKVGGDWKRTAEIWNDM